MNKIKEPKRDQELPVTKRYLSLVKQELKGEISSIQNNTKSISLEVGALREETKSIRLAVGALQDETKSIRIEVGTLRDEIKSIRLEVGALREESKSIRIETGSLREETGSLRLETTSLRHEIGSLRLEMKAGFAQVDAKFDELKTQMTKMLILLEDQNDRNRVALDGYSTVYEKFTETETRVGKLEVRVFGIQQK